MKLISLSVSVQYVHLLVSLIIMWSLTKDGAGNTKGGSITVPIDLLFDWFGLDSGLQIKTKIISCHTADSKPVKQEVNTTVILPPLVLPGWSHPLPTVQPRSNYNVKNIRCKQHNLILPDLTLESH